MQALIKPEQLTAIIDTREKTPLHLGLATVGACLSTGDYSVRGLERLLSVERKSLPDLLACCGRDRPRFERELDRLRAYPSRCLVIESSWGELEVGCWRSSILPQQVIGSLLGWAEMGIPLILAGDHRRAGKLVSRFLTISARRRWRELRHLASAVESGQ